MKLVENSEKISKYEIDMTSGNIFKKLVVFCLPLILSGMLQLFYNAADLAIVGSFSGKEGAVGAVGSTGALIGLVTNLFIGLSVGANVLTARYFASKADEKLSRVVHTAITISLVSGILLGIIGVIFAPFFLGLMSNPNPLATVYLRIYFIGMPFNLVYNFASGILRGVGDTKRPLTYLTIAGIINVILNLVFVIVFKMDVDGVSIATVISQAVSCVLIIRCLMKSKESYNFSIKKLRLYKEELIDIVKIGIPAGIQGVIFSISNVIIQSTVNLFGTTIQDGNAAAQSLEGFVFVAMNSVYHASLAFVGQNMGVKNYKNIKKIMWYCLAIVSILGIGLGGIVYIFNEFFIGFYTKNPISYDVAFLRLHYLCLPYFLYGIVDVMVGVLRGMKRSILPMIVSIIGICGFRILWIFLIFHNFANTTDIESLHLLYVSYPISWIMTFIAHFITYKVCYKKLLKSASND